MTLRSVHGTGRKGRALVAIEAMPPDELPAGVADPRPSLPAMPAPPYARGSAEASEAGRRGGASRAGTVAMADSLGMLRPDANGYRKRADTFRRTQVAYLRQHVGGGQLAPDVRLLVKLAALQAAASERAFDKGDDAAGSARAIEARTTLATAREYAAREAQQRGADQDWSGG